MSEIKVSFVIINYNGKIYLEKCLASIIKNVSGITYEIIVVDDASTDGSAEMVRTKFSQVKLIVNDREMFSDFCLNRGVVAARGEYIHFLMPDTELTLGTEEELLKFMDERKDVVALTSKVVYPDGKFQQNACRDHTLEEILLNYTFLGKIFPVRKKIINYFYNYKDIKDWSNNLEIENCGLTHMLVRREVFSKIG
ncbi:MAG: glycosyltransferase, partial [Endomicrobia bacterium]|nr:glycosyltransferase [Endomicrobiia bacterium]